jgi:hypothetical protein
MLEVVVRSSCNMLAACSLLDDLRRATDWCRAADLFMEPTAVRSSKRGAAPVAAGYLSRQVAGSSPRRSSTAPCP